MTMKDVVTHCVYGTLLFMLFINNNILPITGYKAFYVTAYQHCIWFFSFSKNQQKEKRKMRKEKVGNLGKETTMCLQREFNLH